MISGPVVPESPRSARSRTAETPFAVTALKRSETAADGPYPTSRGAMSRRSQPVVNHPARARSSADAGHVDLGALLMSVSEYGQEAQ